MVPDPAISSSSSNLNSSSRSGETGNNSSTNTDDDDDDDDNNDDYHRFKTWESGNWCWLDDHTSNDVKHQEKEEEEKGKEVKLINGTNGDDDTGVKREEKEHNDSTFNTKNSITADDGTRVKKEREEDNESTSDNTNNSRNSDDNIGVRKEQEKDNDGSGFDTTNDNENKNNYTRKNTTVSDDTITCNTDDHHTGWTTGNWCWERRPNSTTTIAERSVVAATTSVTVFTSSRNKRKLKQSGKNHKKKPRTINQNNKNKNNNNTNLDEGDNSDGLHDDGNDDDDDDDDDYSDVNCDDSNDDESEPDKSSEKSTVVAEASMHNGGAIVRNKYEERWNKMYGRLLKYKKQYKCTCVPRSYKADPQLGPWVNIQRVRCNNLTAERKHRLDSIGFIWDAQDARWKEIYERLVAYKKKYKSTCVPNLYKADQQLGKWVSTQRLRYNKLTIERKHQLNSIDFVWDPLDTLWTEMYGEIVAYKEEYGSTCVPIKYKANPRLGQWVSNQRTRKSKLTADRINRLHRIGFVWKVTK